MKLKTIFSLLILVGILSFSTKEKTRQVALKNSVVAITEAQRAYAVAELQRTKNLLEKELKGLNDEQLKFKPAPDKWSIAEVVEHIALAENGIFQITQATLKAPADSLKRKEIKVTEADIKQRLTNRTTKVQSPEIIKPTGQFPSATAAYQAFTNRREATIQYISTTNDDLLNHFWQHPATGTIDLYQTILLIAAHSERHILQIIEVKSDGNFPSGN
ncbi:MAG TPA: DinB family protein [Chitinophagaceae bacterium]|nr:DinB family protein [Chitinophagaceae bacterium]